MDGRVDSAKYQTGVAICENFIPSRQGPLIKRPGTKFIGVLSGISTAHLALFDAGVDGRFIVEFTNTLIRFWNEDGTLVESGGSTLEIVSTYLEAELSKISCVMNKGTMYVVHPNHTPAKIEMGTTPPFTLTSLTFTGGRTFDASGDYPSCQTFKGGRWYLAATENEPNAIFASRTPEISSGTDRFTDFTFSEDVDGVETVLSSHAIYLQETDLFGSKINWLINQKRILAGAGSSIWMDGGVIATPSTFDMSITLSGGCNSSPARAIDSYVLFAGPGGQSLNVMHYNSESDGYLKTDISQSATHMITSGIKNFVVTGMKGKIIWVLCEDGSLSSCSFDPEVGVIGWARHPMGAGSDGETMKVKSLEIMPGNEDADDVLWLTVMRSGKLYIESLAIPSQETSTDEVYVDCSTTIEFETPTNTVTVGHLADESVDAVGDDALLPVITCDETGTVTYDRSFSKISIGFPLEARVRLLRPELPANGATSQGKLRQVERLVLRLYKSLGGKIGVDYGDDMRRIIPLVLGEYELGSSFSLFTGDKEADIPSYADIDGRVWIVSDEPFPFTLLAVMTKYGVLEV